MMEEIIRIRKTGEGRYIFMN